MKAVFIINPIAGKGKLQEQLRQNIAAQLPPDTYEIHISENEADVMAFADSRSAVGDDIMIFACGGDGTFFEVINGVRGRVPVGIVPCGSGNDFAKNIVNGDFFDTAKLVDGEIVEVDLMECNQQLVSNTCNIGFDANIAYNMNKFKNWPLVSGKMAYLLSLVYCLFHRLAYPMAVEIDGETLASDEYLFVLCANGAVYGGGFRGAPRAVINDGKMDYCLCKKVPLWKIVSLVADFRAGRHVDNPKFEQYISYGKCNKVSVKAEMPTVLGRDGNCHLQSAAEIRIMPKALRLVLPKGAKIAEGQ